MGLQEIGTRVSYGEPVMGLGVSFQGQDKYHDMNEYLNYQYNCLRDDSVDVEDEDFEGVPLVMSMKSASAWLLDGDRAELIPTKRKIVRFTNEFGVKVIITIKERD